MQFLKRLHMKGDMVRIDPRDAVYLQEDEEKNWSNEKPKLIEAKKPRPRDIIYKKKLKPKA